MRYRKLRIAWSVACAIACLLLMALWVRSYAVLDFVHRHNAHLIQTAIGFFSVLFAFLAVAPWLRWRFSISTMLIATALVAVVLGAIVYVES
jgi:hypothetical protein